MTVLLVTFCTFEIDITDMMKRMMKIQNSEKKNEVLSSDPKNTFKVSNKMELDKETFTMSCLHPKHNIIYNIKYIKYEMMTSNCVSTEDITDWCIDSLVKGPDCDLNTTTQVLKNDLNNIFGQ